MSDHDVLIYMRNISIEVVIPKGNVWEFMLEFGNEFAATDHHAGGKEFKSVKSYYSHPNG